MRYFSGFFLFQKYFNNLSLILLVFLLKMSYIFIIKKYKGVVLWDYLMPY